MLKPKITLKQEECPAQIAAIAEETIKDSYPKYYPSGAVAFFLNLHNELNIASVKNQERIYLVCQKETVIGTISVRANEICRFFYPARVSEKRIWQLRNGFDRRRIVPNISKHTSGRFLSRRIHVFKTRLSNRVL